MPRPNRTLPIAVLALSLSTAAYAGSPHATSEAISRASSLIGDPIEDSRGWRIGVLDDLLVDPADGRIAFAVVRAGGRFEAPTDPLALPLPDPKVGTAGGNLRANVEMKDLKRLSPLSSALEELEPAARARLVSLKAVMDASLESRQGAGIGDVDDAVVDIRAGRVKYLVADYDPSWRASGKEVAITKIELRSRRDGDDLVVLADPQRLQSAAEFDPAGAGLPRDSLWTKALDYAGLR